MAIRESIDDLFWSKVDFTENCWEWAAGFNLQGYGVFHIKRKQYLAHRVAWTLVCGPIPEGMLVCHYCDNTSCVKSSHLFLGTAKDNTRDMISKGRSNWSEACKGEESGRAKLTKKEVREIREKYASGCFIQRELAEEYKISRRNISSIVTYVSWKEDID